jgi:polar amino acid transport system substrate-binding protein
MIAMNFGHGLMFGPEFCYFPELFGPNVRYSGASLGFQVSAAIGGGFAPITATAMVGYFGGATGVSIMMIVLALFTLSAALAARETREMARQLDVPVEYVVHQNSGQITDAASKGTWDVTFLPKDPERETRMSFGPIYEVADATYIVKPGSPVTNFQTLDQPCVRVAAVNNTTTMRGAIAHLKQATVMGYQTYDEIFGLLASGEIDAFAMSRDQLNAMARKIPGTRVLDETFKQTVTAVAVPLKHPQSLAFVTGFMTATKSNGALRKAYDDNGLKDTPILAK